MCVPHIKKAASDFDLYQVNPVKVSRRNGINYVFDGQHTTEIIAMVSGSRETPVWCMVYDDLCYEEVVNKELSKKERISEFIKQIKNPYCFKCGDFIVKARYTNNGLSMEDCLQSVIL